LGKKLADSLAPVLEGAAEAPDGPGSLRPLLAYVAKWRG
jgi:hypothetical protein